MAIKLDTFSSAGGGAGTDNLDDVTSRGATTTNAITVGGVTVGTEYTLPSADGSTNQYLKTDGAGNLSFADLDITGGLTYQGAFNATAGTPDISNAEKGDFYVIDTAGTIYGQTWAVGDHLLVNEDMGGTITDSKIDKIDNTDQVTSVNGNTGAVVLSADDLAADHTATHYTAANANIDGHLSGIDTKLGTVASPTLDDVTTNGNTTTNTIEVGQVTVSGDILASSADTRTIGEEDTRFITYYGDMNGAIRFKAKNNQGSAITKGQVVYISGVSGTVPEVKLAKADSALTMPAFGVAFANANDQAEVQIVTFGNLTDYNTTTYSLSANDTIYVSATTAGALTNTAPTGESNLIQNIGRVVRADASAGIIKVGGAGRSNATPNLNDGKIFLGNASNQAVSTALSSINLTSFNDDLSYLSSGDNISLLTNDAGYLTNINSESIDDLSDVVITTASSGQVLSYNGTNWVNSAASAGSLAGLSDTTITSPANGEVLKYNGSSWVDVQLAYSELSGIPTNVSTFTNDAGYLTNINSESIDDLSDVTITAAANGEVLKYNGSAWVDAQLAYSELSGTPTNVSTFTNDAGYLTNINSESIDDLSDVVITTALSGQVLSYNGTNWVNSAASAGSLAGLSDTTITSPANGEVLKYNGSSWVDVQLAYSELSGTPTNVSTFTNDAGYLTNINSESINDLNDVTITAAANGEVLKYNGSAWVDAQLAYSELSGTPTNVSTFTNDAGYLTNINSESINDLSDVTITAAANGEVLKYNGSAWVDANVDYSEVTNTPTNVSTFTNDAGYLTNINSESIDDLSDVIITTASNGQVLSYNGTNWVNAAASGGGSVPNLTSASPSTDYTISTNSGIEEIYILNPSASINVNLPSASTATSGYKYNIKNVSATHSLTVDPNSTETIDGATTYTLNVQYQSLTIVSDGSNWHII